MAAICPGIGDPVGNPVIGVGVPNALVATETFRVVTYVSNGAIGPMARELYPRTSFSLPRKYRSKIGTPPMNEIEFASRTALLVDQLPTVPAKMRKAKTSGLRLRLRRTGMNCE